MPHQSSAVRQQQVRSSPAQFQRRVLQYPGTKDSFERLKEAGADPGILCRFLWVLARLPERHTKREWYAMPDMPIYKLRRLPKRVGKWAKEIEGVNKTMQADPIFGAVAPAAIRAANPNALPDGLAQNFALLPFWLNAYAKYLQTVLPVVALLAKKAVQRVEGMEANLVYYVERATGTQHYQDVADLLAAAYSAAGLHRTVDSAALKMACRRIKLRKRSS